MCTRVERRQNSSNGYEADMSTLRKWFLTFFPLSHIDTPRFKTRPSKVNDTFKALLPNHSSTKQASCVLLVGVAAYLDVALTKTSVDKFRIQSQTNINFNKAGSPVRKQMQELLSHQGVNTDVLTTHDRMIRSHLQNCPEKGGSSKPGTNRRQAYRLCVHTTVGGILCSR